MTPLGRAGPCGGVSLGIIGGPVGAILGGLAGAVGGWWAGKGLADLVTQKDDTHFRNDYEAYSTRFADLRYEDVRPAYIVGHLAGRNPDYAGKSFEEVEPDLQRSWTADAVTRHTEWPAVRTYARRAFERARNG